MNAESPNGERPGKRLSISLIVISCAALLVFVVWLERAGAVESASSLNDEMQDAATDFSKFLHTNHNHARLPCLLCHQREKSAGARPRLPGGSKHLPCTGCHAQQFANSDGPICSICHTDPRSGAVKPFPSLKSFGVSFDHARHMKIGSVSCGTCHRRARGGISLSIPAGFNAHTTCNRCHGPQAQSVGRDISSCGACHKLGAYSRTPAWTAAFRMKFSHAEHGSGQKLACNDCHKVRAGLPQRRQVTAPEPANHHTSGRTQSCNSCHDGKRAFGGDDFSVCKRCHQGSAWHF